MSYALMFVLTTDKELTQQTLVMMLLECHLSVRDVKLSNDDISCADMGDRSASLGQSSNSMPQQ